MENIEQQNASWRQEADGARRKFWTWLKQRWIIKYQMYQDMTVHLNWLGKGSKKLGRHQTDEAQRLPGMNILGPHDIKSFCFFCGA